jgi:hypothetical protein
MAEVLRDDRGGEVSFDDVFVLLLSGVPEVPVSGGPPPLSGVSDMLMLIVDARTNIPSTDFCRRSHSPLQWHSIARNKQVRPRLEPNSVCAKSKRGLGWVGWGCG